MVFPAHVVRTMLPSMSFVYAVMSRPCTVAPRAANSRPSWATMPISVWPWRSLRVVDMVAPGLWLAPEQAVSESERLPVVPAFFVGRSAANPRPPVPIGDGQVEVVVAGHLGFVVADG